MTGKADYSGSLYRIEPIPDCPLAMMDLYGEQKRKVDTTGRTARELAFLKQHELAVTHGTLWFTKDDAVAELRRCLESLQEQVESQHPEGVMQ